ncbi:hypothetical protein EGT34_00040 [Acinetobacter sp. FDAARGOS_558]|nr:hypothetical protein EGT34_00040 [Acinetobacter sp. FDAARGOS_558]
MKFGENSVQKMDVSIHDVQVQMGLFLPSMVILLLFRNIKNLIQLLLRFHFIEMEQDNSNLTQLV